MELTSAEAKEDRKLGYILILEQIISDPHLLMEFHKIRNTDLQHTYIMVDARIRELRLQPKQEEVK